MCTNRKIPGCTLKLLSCTCIHSSQFYSVKFLGVQHASVKCSYYSQFLGIHIKGTQKYLTPQCKMDGQEEPLSDKDTSTDLELVASDNILCSQPSASIPTAPLPPVQTYFSKQRRLQITRCTKGTVADTALFNSTPFAEQCYNIIQYLHSPEIDTILTILMTNMQGRKADRYKWDDTRQKLFYPHADQFKNSK